MKFALKDLGSLHYFLGVKFWSFASGIFLSQTKYTKDLLNHAKMLDYSNIATPISCKINLFNSNTMLVDATKDRSIVGGL